MMEMHGDAELLAAWQAGNEESFGTLVARHHGIVRAACARQAAAGDVDDCVQAVFLVLARRPSVASRSPSLAAWLLRVARYVCRHARRAAHRRQRGEQAAATDLVADGDTPLPDALSHLDECLLRLPEKQRMAVVMRFLAGREPEEIAAALGTSRNNASQLISRGLATLRSLLARRGVAMGSVALASLLAGEAQAATVPAAASVVSTLTAAKSSTAAATLSTGAMTSMSIAAITPILTAAGLLLAIGTLSLAFSGEPLPAPVAAPAVRAEWTTQRFSEVVAAAGPGADYSVKTLLMKRGGSQVELPPGPIDRRKDLALAAWQLGYQAIFAPGVSVPPGRPAFIIEPTVGGSAITRVYDIGDLCQNGDDSARRAALLTLSATRGQAACFAHTLVVSAGAVQHAYVERLLGALRATPHPVDGSVVFREEVAIGPDSTMLNAALEQRYPDGADPAVTVREIVERLRRHGIPILVQPGLAHLDEELRPAPTSSERIRDLLPRLGEALAVRYAVEGRLVLMGLTAPAEQRWMARWFQRPAGKPAGTLGDFTACLQLQVAPAGVVAPWGDGVIVLSPEMSMECCVELVRALNDAVPGPPSVTAPGF